jgi:hypothetical protein
MLLPGCKNYEKENQHLKDEVRMLREENDYHKAEIVGLKKELAELSTKIREEHTALQRKFDEERAELVKKLQDEREAMQKKAQEAGKKNGVARTETKAPTVSKKEPSAGVAKATQPRPDDSRTQAPKNVPRP